MNIKENKQILLISPRGFCAGVTRAIDTVVEVLEKFGPPVYVKHEIVHNKHVIDDLKAKGAIFIEDINDAPIDKPLVFSAHGVAKNILSLPIYPELKISDAMKISKLINEFYKT